MRRFAAAIALATSFFVILTATGASALFGGTATGSMNVATDRIFPTTRSTSAWDVRDSSAGGSAANATDVTAAVDARLFTSAALPTAFSSTRYVEFTMSAPLPAGTPVSSVALVLRMAEAGGGTTCVYVEVRRASTGAVLGTHGSSGTPLACNATTTQSTTTTNLTYVTTSDVADDLKLRVYARNSSSQKLTIDRAAVTGTAYAAFTLYEVSTLNATSTTPATTAWSLAGSGYTSASAWTAAFNASRYLKVTFPGYVPTGSVVSSATLTHKYATSTTGTTCYWVEVYSSTTLLASHGSATTPVSCSSSTAVVTDVIDLPEIDSVTKANNAVVRLYVNNSAAAKSRHTEATLELDYSLS